MLNPRKKNWGLLVGRYRGGMGKLVMIIKEGTFCNEHWVLYATDESLNSTPETNSTLYVNYWIFYKYLFLKILFIYLWETWRERERERERQRHRQREKQAPCRDPDVGLNPGSLGSRPGQEAALNPLSHQGCPCGLFLLMKPSSGHAAPCYIAAMPSGLKAAQLPSQGRKGLERHADIF